MYKTVSITRVGMFERVWSTPLLQLAKDIGVSDVALGKACRRAKIPLPGRGYWAKDPTARRQPKLPENHDAFHDTLRFRVLDLEAAEALAASRKSMPRSAVGNDQASGVDEPEAIVVPTTLDAPHPLVARTLQLARKAEVYEGRLVLDRKEALQMRVSADMLDRALRILDTLIKESERRGCSWAVTEEGTTTVTYDGEPMKVELKERFTRREIPSPPPPAPRRGRRAAWESTYEPAYYPRHEWVSTGELTFLIDERGGSGTRRNWMDAKHTLIEAKLGSILDGLASMAAAIKAEREKWAEWKRQRELEEARQAECAREAERLRQLRVRLVDAMRCWEHAERLRRFTHVVEAHLAHQDESEATAGMRWLAWARQQADLLDPVISRFATMTSLKVDVPDWFTGRNSWEKTPFDWWGALGKENPGHQDEEAPVSIETPDSSAYWRRIRSGWHG